MEKCFVSVTKGELCPLTIPVIPQQKDGRGEKPLILGICSFLAFLETRLIWYFCPNY